MAAVGEKTRARRKMWPAWAVAALIVPAAGIFLLARHRAAAEGPLRTAASAMRGGQWDAARAALGGLPGPLLLPGGQRRQAAELFFRLGEDRQAHRYLLGQHFDPRDPGDVRLRELGIRCQRAALAVAQAEKAHGDAKLRLLREAHEQLPEAPDLFRQLVESELARMVVRGDAAAEAEFTRDYASLRLHSPSAADTVKRNAAAAGTTER